MFLDSTRTVVVALVWEILRVAVETAGYKTEKTYCRACFVAAKQTPKRRHVNVKPQAELICWEAIRQVRFLYVAFYRLSPMLGETDTDELEVNVRT